MWLFGIRKKMGTTIVKETRQYLKTASPEIRQRVEEALADTNFGGKIKLLSVDGLSGDWVSVKAKKQEAHVCIGPLNELILANKNPSVKELNKFKAEHTYPDFRETVNKLING